MNADDANARIDQLEERIELLDRLVDGLGVELYGRHILPKDDTEAASS